MKKSLIPWVLALLSVSASAQAPSRSGRHWHPSASTRAAQRTREAPGAENASSGRARTHEPSRPVNAPPRRSGRHYRLQNGPRTSTRI